MTSTWLSPPWPKRATFLLKIAVPAISFVTVFVCFIYLPHGSQRKHLSVPQPTPNVGSLPAPPCIRNPPIAGDSPNRNFTIVTAYFNIGSVQKGNADKLRSPKEYGSWMWPYAYVLNGIVAYFDDEQFAKAFANLRRDLPTRIVMVNRSTLWAFSKLNETAHIFAQPDYPRSYPKSTSPEYVAVMHAKTELTERTVRENPYGSIYFAWMDMGVYRALPRSATDEFMLRAPDCLCDNTVFFGRVHPLKSLHLSPRDVMREGLDWVAGGLFIARADAMQAYCADYRWHVEEFLRQGLANHDQSVIYAMYLPSANPRPIVPLQAISTIHGNGDDQFFYTALQLRRLALFNQRLMSSGSQRLWLQKRSCTFEMYG